MICKCSGIVVLIGAMWLLMSIFFPKNLEDEARKHAETATEECAHHNHKHAHEGGGRWTRVASAFWMDWRMLWKELVAGFLIAGFLGMLMPPDWWKALFIESGSPFLRLIENAAVGPIIAILSFVCSIGNIPLASLLWANGISFGGVIAFIYADLIVFPIINIYRKYYGWKVTALIVAVFYIAMALAALIVEFLFSLLRLIPQHRSAQIVETTISLNYTTMLNVLFLAIAAFLLGRFFRTGGPKMLAHMD